MSIKVSFVRPAPTDPAALDTGLGGEKQKLIPVPVALLVSSDLPISLNLLACTDLNDLG